MYKQIINFSLHIKTHLFFRYTLDWASMNYLLVLDTRHLQGEMAVITHTLKK